jgi:ATP-dependent DNA helicase DinG
MSLQYHRPARSHTSICILRHAVLIYGPMNAHRIFGEAGVIAAAMRQAYEFRPQQMEMARAVEQALASKAHLIAEAGTGVGKSLAYLVPLISWTRAENCRAVVATYTKALQQQLVEKDLPFLKRVLGDFRYTLCVGGENYLCLRRFDALRIGNLYEQNEIEPLNRLFEWSTRTRTGLRMELDVEPPASLWSKAGRQADLCLGRDCAFHKDCFYLKAKAVEQQSHILVANHHLFFADMATGGNVLPQYKAAVFDEAHQVEDVATDYLGVEISNFAVRYLLDQLISQRTRKGLLTRLTDQGPPVQELRGMVDGLRVVAENFFLNLHPLLDREPSIRIRKPGVIPDILSDPLMELRDGLLALGAETQEEEFEIKAFASRAQALGSAVRINLSQSAEGCVYWAEREHQRRRLVASPIEVADTLREQLFAKIDTVVLSSATLSAGGSFTYIRNRLGLDAPVELLLDSPFDFERHALLYIARDLNDQQAAGYQEKFDSELKAVLAVTQGRTLVLFTSYGQLRKSADALRKELPDLDFLCQGEMPAYRMLEQFKNSAGTVLMGTASFWQGIDIPGEALQCVVIAKLPFAVPDDPIIEARLERLRNPFIEYQVPQATLLFRQGFGRLIRTKTDAGAVAVLDSRITSKSYGRTFLKSVPPCRITDSRQDFEAFFKGLAAGKTAADADALRTTCKNGRPA